eukprot:Awhi_evm1s7607
MKIAKNNNNNICICFFSGTPLTFDANVDGKQEISVCLLVDNGSLKEGSVLSLRFLADALQSKLRAKEQIKNEELEDKKSGEGERKRSAVPFIHVVPCSARFSNRIAKEKLGGISGRSSLSSSLPSIIIVTIFHHLYHYYHRYYPQQLQLHQKESLI